MKDSCQQSVFRIKTRLPRHERAFSLYDALVTLTVVSTVTTVAVPSFQQLTASQRMSGAVNSLVTALHLTRSEAIKRGENAVLCPSTDGRGCMNGGSIWEEGYLLYIDRNGNREADADEIVVRVFGAASGLRLRNTSSHDHVRYMPNGLATLTNATFTFCDTHGRGAPRAVIVSNSGRPRISNRNASGGAISCPTAP